MSQSGTEYVSSLPDAPVGSQLELWESSQPLPETSSTNGSGGSIAKRSRRSFQRRDVDYFPVTLDNIPPQKLYAVWQIVNRQKWFLPDWAKDPYTLGGLLSKASTRMFIVGPSQNEPEGLVYGHSFVPGVSAGIAALIWGRNAAGRYDLARAAMLAVMKFANLHKLYAEVAVPNLIGQRMADSCGLTLEGCLREAMCYNDVWTDVYLYGITRAELEVQT